MNTKRKSLLAALALNLLSAPAVLAASDPPVPSNASLSHAEALRGLEHLLVQREDGRWGHLGMQVLSSVGGALLWAALAPAATNALVPRGDMSSGLGAAILHVAGSGLFASLGPTLLESAWMHEGEVLGEAYQHVLTSAPDRPVPSLPDPLAFRIRESLDQESSQGTHDELSSPKALLPSVSSVTLLPASSRGPMADFLEVTAAGGLNLLVSWALSLAGGQLLGDLTKSWHLAGANYIVSSLALAPLGSGMTDLLLGDPRSALERVGHAYVLTSVTAVSAMAASWPLLGPLAPYSLLAGATCAGGQTFSDGVLAVEKKWSREAAATAELSRTSGR